MLKGITLIHNSEIGVLVEIGLTANHQRPDFMLIYGRGQIAKGAVVWDVSQTNHGADYGSDDGYCNHIKLCVYIKLSITSSQ